MQPLHLIEKLPYVTFKVMPLNVQKLGDAGKIRAIFQKNKMAHTKASRQA